MKSLVKNHKTLVTALLVVALIYAIITVTGLRLCAVQSGSMEPNIPTYSMCFVTTHVNYDELQVGDIVVYTRPSDGLRIIHRVTEITEEGAVTQGDANEWDDGISVTPDTLYGRYLCHIPGLAHIYNLVHSTMGYAVIIILFTLILILDCAEKKTGKKKENVETKD